MFMRRSTIRTFVLVLFLIGYLCAGSVIFSMLEGPKEEQMKTELVLHRQNFMSKFGACVPDEELEAFILEIVKANNRGVSAVANVTSEPNWSFGQSLFFAGTVLTTIGYGHVTPLSEGGKVFCIVYAVIGIPLTLIMFTAVVERLMTVTAKIYESLYNSLKHKYQELHIKFIHLTLVLTVLISCIFLIPAAIFSAIEHNWNFLDAFYYCFISMTTIGLGDYIPGDNPHQPQRVLYKISITFYLFIGLIMMMLTLANIYEIPELNIGYHFYLKSDEDQDPERKRLKPPSDLGPKYTQQIDPETASTSCGGYQQNVDTKSEEQAYLNQD